MGFPPDHSSTGAEVSRPSATALGSRGAGRSLVRGRRPAGRGPIVDVTVARAVLLTALPAAVLLGAGYPRYAGWYFWALTFLHLGTYILRAQYSRATLLFLGLTPFPNLFRDFAFYNIVILVLGGLLAMHAVASPVLVRGVFRRTRLLRPILIYMGLYYLVSLALTWEYANNLRLLEFAFGAACVAILVRNPRAIPTLGLGVCICSCLMGLAFLPHNQEIGRLGIARIGGIHMGNPIQLGLPLAFAFVALATDRSFWAGLVRHPVVRVGLLVIVGGLLALTTSRASWMVAAASLVLVLLFGAGQRSRAVLVVLLVTVAMQLALISPFGEELQKGLVRTFDSGRDVRNRTSGRSDQWKVAANIWSSSTKNMLVGCGPGLGAEAYAKFSQTTEGVEFRVGQSMTLHSLFMQVWAESGLLGSVPVLAGVVYALAQGIRGALRNRLVFPLACTVGYVLTVLTVSGSDTISGIFLGCGLAMSGLRPGPGSPRGRAPAARWAGGGTWNRPIAEGCAT